MTLLAHSAICNLPLFPTFSPSSLVICGGIAKAPYAPSLNVLVLVSSTREPPPRSLRLSHLHILQTRHILYLSYPSHTLSHDLSHMRACFPFHEVYATLRRAQKTRQLAPLNLRPVHTVRRIGLGATGGQQYCISYVVFFALDRFHVRIAHS